MNLVVYDGTFAGMLTTIFDIYERKLVSLKIIKKSVPQDIFAHIVEVVTDHAKAKRVWNGLVARMPLQTALNIHACFLSELEGMEDLLLSFCELVFRENKDVSRDFSNGAVLQVEKISKKVYREKHRMEAFVRFSRLEDDLYYSEVEPDYNVLPLIGEHFAKRYADQDWLIYDKKRAYGIHFNKTTQVLDEIVLNFTDIPSNRQREIFHVEEKLYRQLWKDYFQHANIQARKNLKLHIQHVPIRYWKHLTEKIQL